MSVSRLSLAAPEMEHLRGFALTESMRRRGGDGTPELHSLTCLRTAEMAIEAVLPFASMPLRDLVVGVADDVNRL